MMRKRVWYINMFLAVLVFFIGYETYAVWMNGSREIALTLEDVPAEGDFSKIPKIYQRQVPPEADYEVLAEKNLFAADRKEPVVEEAEPQAAAEETPDPKVERAVEEMLKQISLYGVVIVDELKAALIRHPPATTAPLDERALRQVRYASRRRGNQQLETSLVRLNESLGVFTVADIKADRVLLSDGSGSYEILLYDSEKPKERVQQKPKESAPTVVEVKPGEPVQPAPAPPAQAGAAAPEAVKGPGQPAAPPPPPEAVPARPRTSLKEMSAIFRTRMNTNPEE